MNEQTIQLLQTDMKDMKGKVDKMYFALMGNELARDGGLVGRIEKVEATVEKLEKAALKFAIHQRIMWSCLGAAAGIVFTYIVQTILK
jgi:hypothetical protein